MDARIFRSLLARALPETWPPHAPRSWSAWTAHMVDHLHAVASDAGMACVCQHPHIATKHQPTHTREVLFDFCWYRGEGRYALPDVVIEHENSPHTDDLLYDLWKLMAAQAPLRVMIGYAPTPADWPVRLGAINEVIQSSGWTFPEASEDLILVGTSVMPDPRHFVVFHRPVGGLAFRHAGMLGEAPALPAAYHLLDDALLWLRANLTVLVPMCERDVVWSVQRLIARRIAREELPYAIYNDYPVLDGNRRGRSADLVITRTGQAERWPVDLAVEFKYEPDHARAGQDILAPKLPVIGWGDVVKDTERVREMVTAGRARQALAIAIDAGRLFQERTIGLPPESRWAAWGGKTRVVFTPTASQDLDGLASATDERVEEALFAG